MKKFGRTLAIAIGFIVAVGVVLLLAVNLYVQSQATQARIQQELSQRLGTNLKIRRISVTPWAGLKLTGITIPESNASGAADFLNAKAFQLRVRFASLFSRRLVIKEVSLIEPNIMWKQNAAGKWRLPETEYPVAKPAAETTSEVNTVDAPAPSPSSVEARDANTPSVSRLTNLPAHEEKSTGVAPEIRRVRLKNGDFHFLDEEGRVVANFLGVNFRSSLRNGTALRGTINIANTSLRDRFFLAELQSPLEYDPTVLNLSSVTAKADGGEITGGFSMRPQEADSPFHVHIRFSGLQADRIVTEAGGTKGIITGQLEGMLDGTGKTANPDALSGRGEIFLRNGQVQQYSLLVALGQILQIEELGQLNLDEAHVKYRLSPGLITVDELVLHSPNIRLSATGTITFAGKMKLSSQLALNEKILGRLFNPLRQNFKATKDPGYSAVDFQISGFVDRPKTNLMDKLVGQDLKDLGSVFSNLFGGKHSKKKSPPPVEPGSSRAIPSTPAASMTPGPSP